MQQRQRTALVYDDPADDPEHVHPKQILWNEGKAGERLAIFSIQHKGIYGVHYSSAIHAGD